MARGKQLEEVRNNIIAELGWSANPSANQDKVRQLNALIRRKQAFYYDDFNWSFVYGYQDFFVSAGQRYYAVPSQFNYDGIDNVHYYYSSQWIELGKDIEPQDYTVYDSDADERSDPVLKYDFRDQISVGSGVDLQIELWPIPSINGSSTNGVVRVEGRKKMPPLVADTDRLVLDSVLIESACLADLLARQKSSDAGSKLRDAEIRYNTLRANDPKRKTITMGISSSEVGSGRFPLDIRVVRGGD